MPGNYILMYGSPAGEKRDRILTAADAELDAIAGRIGAGERVTLPYAPLLRLARAIVYPRFRSRVHGEDRTFTVTEACTSCGTCARVCPAENITMVDGRPVWNHRCELCCGCIHLCPVEAIQARKATEGRQRYRNPSVGVAELERRRGAVSGDEA
jgi:ferredoxin